MSARIVTMQVQHTAREQYTLCVEHHVPAQDDARDEQFTIHATLRNGSPVHPNEANVSLGHVAHWLRAAAQNQTHHVEVSL